MSTKTDFVQIASCWESKSGASYTGRLSLGAARMLGLPADTRIVIKESDSDNRNAPDFHVSLMFPGDEEEQQPKKTKRKRKKRDQDTGYGDSGGYAQHDESDDYE